MMIYSSWYNLGSISARLWFRSLRLCCAWVAVGLRMLLGGSCVFWLVRSCSGKLLFLCGMIRNGWQKPLRTFRLSLFCVTISHLRFGLSCQSYPWSWSARDSLKLSAKKEKMRKPNKKQSRLDYLYDRSNLNYIYTNLWSIKSFSVVSILFCLMLNNLLICWLNLISKKFTCSIEESLIGISKQKMLVRIF